MNKGVPGFFVDQDTKDYFESTHHSRTDTFNHVHAADYLQSIQTLAVANWQFENMTERVPHIQPGNIVGKDK